MSKFLLCRRCGAKARKLSEIFELLLDILLTHTRSGFHTDHGILQFWELYIIM